jgi:dolichol-phosphate mannosyltransferase
MRTLIAIPAFNEAATIADVLSATLAVKSRSTHDVLVIDDGSTDATPHILPEYPVEFLRHARNRGYGSSLRDAFVFAINRRYDYLITMDCDWQHEPAAIPEFLETALTTSADVVSGSRYTHASSSHNLPAPIDRQRINRIITKELNDRLCPVLSAPLTDAFCGFKAYRVRALRALAPTIPGYAFPMQFWVQAAANRLSIVEHPVALIYNDLSRTFGGGLDDPAKRLAHYRAVFEREVFLQRAKLPEHIVANVAGGVGVNCHPVPTLLEGVKVVQRYANSTIVSPPSPPAPASTLLQ